METLSIVISIAILLFIFASFSEKKRKEDVLNDWRSRYTSEDYVPPVIPNKFSSNVVSSDGTGNGKSYPFDSRYDYDANDLSYDDEYGLGAEDADDLDAISEDRESMHLQLSSFYSMR